MAFSSSFSISPRLIEEILRNKNKKKRANLLDIFISS